MWAILVVSIATTPFLNPAVPPPYERLAPPRFETVDECRANEKFYGGHNLIGHANFITFTFDRRTQCVWVRE